MILANVIFGTRCKNEPDQLEDIAETYLATLYKSGQLCREYFLTSTNGRLNAHVSLSSRTAIEVRHDSEYGMMELKKATEAFGAKPVWRILDADASQPTSAWRGAPFSKVVTMNPFPEGFWGRTGLLPIRCQLKPLCAMPFRQACPPSRLVKENPGRGRAPHEP